MMKIMHVIESLGIGGAEQQLTSLLPALQRLGNEVIVAVRTDTLDLARVLQESGVEVVQLPAQHRWNLPGTAQDLSRLAAERHIDIIHAHLYFPAQSVALVKRLRLHGAATVVTFHNLAYAPGVNRGGIALSVKKWLAALLCAKGFDRKIAVSHAVAVHYRAALGLDAIDVIHNPVDIDAIDALQLHRQQHTDASIRIVVPGRLVHEKGHTDLLQALTILRDQGLRFTAVIAGDGPLREELEQTSCLAGLAEIITFTGRLAHRSMLEVVASADIVVIPSRFEGFGLTAIEAMALERPVVVTAVGGLLEIVESGVSGVVVPAQQPPELANALSELAASRDTREAYGRAGRQRVEQLFALPQIAGQVNALYQETVALQQARAAGNANGR
jgi:glycosyltransferase involved in cell wall biosynthesis